MASEQDQIHDMNPDEPGIPSMVAETSETLEDWTSDNEDSGLNFEDIGEKIDSIFFDGSFFGDEPSQKQLDSIDLDLEIDDYFTSLVAPVSLQDFLCIDNKYQEAFKNLAESMKRSQETRESLKFKSPVMEAVKYWEQRRKSISTVLSDIEVSSMHIQQTYLNTIHPKSSATPRS